MKKIISSFLALALLLVLMVPALAEEAERIEQDGFVCERLRNGNLILVEYTKDATGKSVNIPSTIQGSDVERIGAYAFDGSKMVNVTIPNTVKMLEAFAFNDCTEIQTIDIPNALTFMDGNPFTGCTKLVNISLDPKHPTMRTASDGSLYSIRNKMLICYPCSNSNTRVSVLANTLTIGKNAFYDCNKLESLSLPPTVKEIDDGAFMGCSNLISITLPESLLSIGELAFAGCTSLREISLPTQISRVEKSTFFRCESLANVSFPENMTDICETAFFGCKALQEVHVPGNVHSIGAKAFYGCQSLDNAYVPVSVTEIGNNAFDDCSIALRIHTDENTYAEIYAELYRITYDYGKRDSFLIDDVAEPVPTENAGL